MMREYTLLILEVEVQGHNVLYGNDLENMIEIKV